MVWKVAFVTLITLLKGSKHQVLAVDGACRYDANRLSAISWTLLERPACAIAFFSSLFGWCSIGFLTVAYTDIRARYCMLKVARAFYPVRRDLGVRADKLECTFSVLNPPFGAFFLSL